MTTEDTNAYIDVASAALGLEIKPEWKPGVVSFFEVAQKMSLLIEQTNAVTDFEAAPVFTPREVE